MDIYTLALSIAYSNKIGKQIKEELAFKIQIESNRDILNTTGEEKIFYFLPKENGRPQNGYDEYIFFNNNWELMGSTEIDLSNYYTKTEINTKLTKAENIDNKVTSISSSSTDIQYPSAKAVYDEIQSLNIPDMEIKIEKQYSLVKGYQKYNFFHFIKVDTFPIENIQPATYIDGRGNIVDDYYFYINNNNIVQGYLNSDLAYVASQMGLTMPEGWYSILVFLELGFNNPNVKYNGVITNLSDNYEIDSTTGEKDETVFNVLEEYKGIYGIINNKQYKLDNLHIEYNVNDSSTETDIQYSFGDMRIFIESANLYCSNDIDDSVNVLIVNTFPSENSAYPVIGNDDSFNFYYNYFTKELKGFIPSQLASTFGLSEGWYDYQFCADVTNQNIKYLGIVDNLNFSPTFYDFSENIVKQQIGLYLNKKLQYWNGFKWQNIGNIENIASGTGENSLIFNNCKQNQASGNYSHAEGYYTTASGLQSHAEGCNTTASGDQSHAEGTYTIASGAASHAEGNNTTASGGQSHAEGYRTIAQRKSQHVFGEYNIADTTNNNAQEKGSYIEIVGNGINNNARSNARTLDWSGNEVLAGKLTVGAAPTSNMDVATKQYVDNNIGNLTNQEIIALLTTLYPERTSTEINTMMSRYIVDNPITDEDDILTTMLTVILSDCPACLESLDGLHHYNSNGICTSCNKLNPDWDCEINGHIDDDGTGICIHCGKPIEGGYGPDGNHSITNQNKGILNLNSSVNCTLTENDDIVLYTFTPNVTVWANFFSTGDIDTYGCILDDEYTLLKDNDDGNGGVGNFFINYPFIENNTYYLGVSTCVGHMQGSTILHLEEGSEGDVGEGDVEDNWDCAIDGHVDDGTGNCIYCGAALDPEFEP